MLFAIPKLICHALFWILMLAMFTTASVRDVDGRHIQTCWNWSDKRECYVIEAPTAIKALTALGFNWNNDFAGKHRRTSI